MYIYKLVTVPFRNEIISWLTFTSEKSKSPNSRRMTNSNVLLTLCSQGLVLITIITFYGTHTSYAVAARRTKGCIWLSEMFVAFVWSNTYNWITKDVIRPNCDIVSLAVENNYVTQIFICCRCVGIIFISMGTKTRISKSEKAVDSL